MKEKLTKTFKPTLTKTLRVTRNGNICCPIDGSWRTINSEGHISNFKKEDVLDLPILLISREARKGDLIFTKESTLARVISPGVAIGVSGETFEIPQRNSCVHGLYEILRASISNGTGSGYLPSLLRFTSIPEEDSEKIETLLMITSMTLKNQSWTEGKNPVVYLMTKSQEDIKKSLTKNLGLYGKNL